jgi:hypothetical protein
MCSDFREILEADATLCSPSSTEYHRVLSPKHDALAASFQVRQATVAAEVEIKGVVQMDFMASKIKYQLFGLSPGGEAQACFGGSLEAVLKFLRSQKSIPTSTIWLSRS